MFSRLLLLIPVVWGIVLQVPSVSYPTILAAINSAAPGDTISVTEGTFVGNLALSKDNIAIVGSGSSKTIIDCSGSSRCLSVTGTGFQVSNLEFRNGRAPGSPPDVTSRRDATGRSKRSKPNLPSLRKRIDANLRVATIDIFLNSQGKLVAVTRKNRAVNQRKSKVQSGNEKKSVSIRAEASSPIDQTGGCVLITSSNRISISNVTFRNCRSPSGGALAILDSTQISILNSTFVSNGMSSAATTPLTGGALWVRKSNSIYVAFSVFLSNFISGSASMEVTGGGLSLIDCTGVIFNSISFSQNKISAASANLYGAGIFLRRVEGVIFGGENIFNGNSIFSKCIQCDTFGGAFFATTSTNISFSGNSNFIGNLIQRIGGGGFVFGGALYFYDSKLISFFQNVKFESNRMESFGGSTSLTGGAIMLYSSSLVNMLNVEFKNNSISTTGEGGVYGGALGLYNTEGINFTNIFAAENSMYSSGGGLQSGTCLSIYSCKSVRISNSTFHRNFAESKFVGLLRSPIGYIPPAEVDVSVTSACAKNRFINQTSGFISDGSIGNYSSSTDCSWIVKPLNPFNNVFGRFNISFTRLQIERDVFCDYDSVSIYDGGTTSSPLIGKYCDKLVSPQCGNGNCPDIRQYFSTTSAAFFVAFKSDSNTNFDGFELKWELVYLPPDENFDFAESSLPTSISSFPSYGFGGAVTLVQTDAMISSGIFSMNSISHPLVTVGGGLVVGVGSAVVAEACFFIGNFIAGNAVGGGGAGVIDSGILNISNSIFSNNSVIGSGKCIQLYSNGYVCPMAMGGGVSASSKGILSIVGSRADENSAVCGGGQNCYLHGGALGVSLGSAIISDSNFKFNFIFQTAGALWGSGAAIFLASGSADIFGGSIESNLVSGVGGGGGVFSAGKSILRMRGTIFKNNSALEGGGLWAADKSIANISSCIFIQNSGKKLGGGIALSGEILFSLADSNLTQNIANRFSQIFAYNDNEKAQFNFYRNFIVASDKSLILIIGKMDWRESVVNCSSKGTVFRRDENGHSFYSLECLTCEAGTYAVGAASTLLTNRANICRTCAFGATCIGGAADSDGLHSLAGYWGDEKSDGSVELHPCPSGFCCENLTLGCEFNFCGGGRTGTLCGRCGSNYGLSFFSENCHANETCNDAAWAIPLAFVGACGITIFLLLTTGEPSNALLPVVLFFYQVLPLIKSTPWRYTSSAILGALQSIFSMSTSTAGGGDSGVCLMKSMTASQKLGASLLFQGLVAGSFVAVFFAHTFLHIAKIPKFENRPKKTLYAVSFFRFLTIAYTSLVLTPLQMSQCVYLHDKYVWFFDATITCFERWQIAAISSAIILLPLPLFCIALMWKWSDPLCLSERQNMIRFELVDGFREDRRYWLGVSLYRRFLLVLVFTATVDLNWRCLMMTSLSVCFLAMNIILRPFADAFADHGETVSLLFLAFLSASSAPQLAQSQFGTIRDIAHSEGLEYLQFILAILPAAVCFSFLIFSIINSRRKNKNSATPPPSDPPPDGEPPDAPLLPAAEKSSLPPHTENWPPILSPDSATISPSLPSEFSPEIPTENPWEENRRKLQGEERGERREEREMVECPECGRRFEDYISEVSLCRFCRMC